MNEHFPQPSTLTESPTQYMMPQRTNAVKDALFAQPLPPATRTYGPVSNEKLYSTVKTRITEMGYDIIDESFQSSNKNQIMLCKFVIRTPDSLHMNKTIAILNSYNKSRSINIASGATVAVCSNGMFWGSEATFKRKHHSNIWNDVVIAVDSQLETLDKTMKKLNDFYAYTKHDVISPSTIASLAGKLYFKEILSPKMMSDLKREIHTSVNFKMKINVEGKLVGGTVWQFYNNCTQAMKRTPAAQHTQKYSMLTDMIADARAYEI